MSKLQSIVAKAVIGLMFLSGGVAAQEVDNSRMTAKAVEAFDNLVYQIINPFIDQKELQCLAKNIFYESANEPKEGKLAVGIVTINRTKDGRWPSSICGVVNQRTVISKPKQVQTEVKTTFSTRTETKTVWEKVAVCQFSWNCERKRKIKENDPRWLESQEIAKMLMIGAYAEEQEKFSNLLYFHATHVNPRWHNLKREVRIGQHVFYRDRAK